MTNPRRAKRRRYWQVGGSRRGWRLFFYGLAFFVVGLVITVATYAAASGGTYIISYGPMVIGLIAMIRGLIQVAGAGHSGAPQPSAAGSQGFPAGPAGAGGGGAAGAGGPGYGYLGSRSAGTGGPGYGHMGSRSAGPGREMAAGPAVPAQATLPPQATLPAPNWYPDPQDGSRLRWWDGQAWTGHTRLPG